MGKKDRRVKKSEASVLDPRVDDMLRRLESAWSSLPAKDAKFQAAHAVLEADRSMSKERGLDVLRVTTASSDGGGSTMSARQAEQHEVMDRIQALLDRDGLYLEFVDFLRRTHVETGLGSRPDGKPLEKVLCANVDAVNPHKFCSDYGTKVCGRCHLVAYCSKECQQAHWRTHRQDGNSDMAKDDWLPAHLQSMDMRDLMTAQSRQPEEHWWGNMPAMSLLAGEEGDEQVRSVCFAASGDLRNVIITVNALPADGSRRLTVLVNDRNPRVAVRNFVLLLLLLEKGEEAVDLVLHLWYSMALTSPMRLALLESIVQRTVDRAELRGGYGRRKVWEAAVPGGASSSLRGDFPADVWAVLAMMIQAGRVANLQQVSAMRHGRWLHPSGRAKRERYLHKLRPYHRVSWMEFRSFGLLLPMGGLNAHFNVVNPLLVDPVHGWLLHAAADPLEGWPLPSVLESGRRHGVPRHDLYGALHFHLREQLTRFVVQLRSCRVDLRLTCMDACHLAAELAGTAAFDRIDLSNIVDKGYLGISRAVGPWAPLIKPRGVITAYFMNWHADSGLEETLKRRAMQAAAAERQQRPKAELPAMTEVMHQLGGLLNTSFARIDTCPEFRAYLEMERAEEIAASHGLILRERHSVMPPRLGVEVGADWHAMPDFSTSADPTEEAYGYECLSTTTAMHERFVEFVVRSWAADEVDV